MRSVRAAIVLVVSLVCCVAAGAGQRPPDMRPDHWAGPAVARLLQAGVLRLQPDGKFHGDAKVTREEAAVALARIGRDLVEGTWKPAGKSRAVPDSVAAIWDKTAWKSAPVRRYTFAAVLARYADYVANGVPRPAAGAKVGKSEALPTATVSASPKSPAYESLVYLAHNRMVLPGSPLLKPSDTTLQGGELSRALTDLTLGVNDRLTDLGQNPDGSTPDDAFHKR